MVSPERFANLPAYAFPRLRRLLHGIQPGGNPIILTIGEPRHAFPDWVPEVLAASVGELAKYPPNDGTPELLEAISGWLLRRHGLALGTDRITVVNGTREGMFNALLALCPERKAGRQPAVLIPNPFYQVYAVAAAAVDAEAVFVSAGPESGGLPDFTALPAEVLERTAIAWLCSPANPQGAVASEDYLQQVIKLAERHDFMIFSDECYSEIWRDTPPPGALAVAERLGLGHRVMMFNSLSKRSNLPGVRSGFAAGPAEAIAACRRLRSYAGAPLPLPMQRLSERAWAEESHVEASRALYQQKYAIADRILGDVPGYQSPEGGFFLWLPVPEVIGDGEAAARKLWAEAGVQVLPGAYLARDAGGVNPGAQFIRVALVATATETEAALIRLRDCLYQKEG